MIKRVYLILILILFLTSCSKQDVTGNIVEPLKDVEIVENIEIAKEIPVVEVKQELKTDFNKFSSKEECEANGGDWILSPGYEEQLHYSCHVKFDDVGKNCIDNGDCMGDCLPEGNIGGYTAYGKCSLYNVHDSCQTVVMGALYSTPGCV